MFVCTLICIVLWLWRTCMRGFSTTASKHDDTRGTGWRIRRRQWRRWRNDGCSNLRHCSRCTPRANKRAGVRRRQETLGATQETSSVVAQAAVVGSQYDLFNGQCDVSGKHQCWVTGWRWWLWTWLWPWLWPWLWSWLFYDSTTESRDSVWRPTVRNNWLNNDEVETSLDKRALRRSVWLNACDSDSEHNAVAVQIIQSIAQITGSVFHYYYYLLVEDLIFSYVPSGKPECIFFASGRKSRFLALKTEFVWYRLEVDLKLNKMCCKWR